MHPSHRNGSGSWRWPPQFPRRRPVWSAWPITQETARESSCRLEEMSLLVGREVSASGVGASRETGICQEYHTGLGVGRKERSSQAGRPLPHDGDGPMTLHRVYGGCPNRAFLVGL